MVYRQGVFCSLYMFLGFDRLYLYGGTLGRMIKILSFFHRISLKKVVVMF